MWDDFSIMFIIKKTKEVFNYKKLIKALYCLNKLKPNNFNLVTHLQFSGDYYPHIRILDLKNQNWCLYININNSIVCNAPNSNQNTYFDKTLKIAKLLNNNNKNVEI